MSARRFRLFEGSIQQRFLSSRAKVQMLGGGFGNGKTSASCIKALQIARDYPGSNGLIARSTYPKLNDTIRAEFLKWCPSEWIKSFPRSNNGSNTCTMDNGSTINFRYISQEGTGQGDAVSNQLSATYDYAVVDQVEDPQITHKDFLDLIGRLRGNTRYAGTDRTMPETGPRWLILTCNPTRNWVYHELVAPLHRYMETGYIDTRLICERDPVTGHPALGADGKPRVMIDLFEASTYDNAENLGPDYIQLLESTYRGVMRDRYLLGRWGAFEGLVYPSYDAAVHVVRRDEMFEYLHDLIAQGFDVQWQEGYDYGLAVASCYLMAFVDPHGNVFVCAGYHQPELRIDEQQELIKDKRREWSCPSRLVYADPSIFRRGPVSAKLVGRSTADIMWNGGAGIRMVRGNNDISNGIVKVQAHLHVSEYRIHPLTGASGSPRIFFSDELDFLDREFTSYMWAQDSRGERDDKPMDRNDHAMDTLRYLLTKQPSPSRMIQKRVIAPPPYMSWHERDLPTERASRYGYAA